MRFRFALGEALKWSFANAGKAMVAYACPGALVGAATGYFNWQSWQILGNAGGSPLLATMAFTFVANAVWSAFFAAIVTLPLFLVLFALMPRPRDTKARQKEVLLALILPCAALQFVGPAFLGALYISMPSVHRWLQSWIPSGNVGDVLVRSQYGFLLVGSWAGAALVAVLWCVSVSKNQSSGSRLLPID